MKILVSGKGGVGKTTISALLARLLARQGLHVTALDGDSNPNLALALGMGDLSKQVRSVRNELGAPSAGRPIEQILDYGVEGPDGIRLVQTGEIKRPSEGCLCCGSHMTLRDVFARVPTGEGHAVVTDLEPGVNDVLWAYPKPGDIMIIVTDSSRKSLEVGRRLRDVAGELGLSTVLPVANQAERADDIERARDCFPGLRLFSIPDDAAVRRADRDGLSVLDFSPDCAAVRAVAELAAELLRPAPAR